MEKETEHPEPPKDLDERLQRLIEQAVRDMPIPEPDADVWSFYERLDREVQPSDDPLREAVRRLPVPLPGSWSETGDIITDSAEGSGDIPDISLKRWRRMWAIIRSGIEDEDTEADDGGMRSVKSRRRSPAKNRLSKFIWMPALAAAAVLLVFFHVLPMLKRAGKNSVAPLATQVIETGKAGLGVQAASPEVKTTRFGTVLLASYTVLDAPEEVPPVIKDYGKTGPGVKLDHNPRREAVSRMKVLSFTVED